jgi:hypothetical protein
MIFSRFIATTCAFLQTETLKFHEFYDDDVSLCAILSHIRATPIEEPEERYIESQRKSDQSNYETNLIEVTCLDL